MRWITAIIVSITLISAGLGCEKTIKEVRTNDGQELVATGK
jgi:hypothetical protein